MTQVPIADYALLSDCHSAALVSRDGSVDWLCFPRFDSPSVFARLLDEAGGHWSLAPSGPAETTRRYVGGTMVLETTFRTETGAVTVTDAMALGPDERGHDLGMSSPGALLRRVECVDGQVEMLLHYAPRPEYALVSPLLEPIEGGVLGRGGANVLVLSSALRLEATGGTIERTFGLRAGERQAFAIHHASSWEPRPETWSQKEIEERLQDATNAWWEWSEMHQSYEGPWQELVRQSGRVLQALTFQPTGAIVAAPTTSLPETVGGIRNWDYRYTWVRDASLTMEALWVAACPDEAERFFDWMTGAVASDLEGGADLQIMFGVGGEHELSERELRHLSGWRDSKPVRIGNGAWEQRQLDVYGELLSAAHRLEEQLEGLSGSDRRFLVAVADAAEARWEEKDHGIWEIRGEPRHFLYSKLMCWVALDRAIALSEKLVAGDRVEKWRVTREKIRAAILEQGWSERAGAFSQSFGSDELDASALTIPLVGFLPADDPRVRSTVDAIAERLTDPRGLVYRYLAPDGLAGEEGTFLLCTFWLSHAQALAGDTERARETFERAVAHANDVLLLAEEVHPDTGELLGNFPQAFSHIGLVNAAWAIAQAEGSAD